MGARPKQKQQLDPALVGTMMSLTRAGYQLLPLGGGDDGKAPLLKFGGVHLTLKQVLGPMSGHGSAMFGIRLEGLVVLDLDEDDPELVEALEARFGPAVVHVRTSRGRHLWYRAPEGPLPNLRGEGLPVDVKSGVNAYVAGPGSVRRDGARYILAKGDLASDTLTVLRLPGSAVPHDALPSGIAPGSSPRLGLTLVEGGKVPEGQRHNALVKEAVRAVRHVHSREELIALLRMVADRNFANPATTTNQEIEDAASWAWALRLSNSLWSADHSTFPMSRQVRDRLKGQRYGKEAWWLLSTLIEAHGHMPGKTFVLDRKAMNAADLDLSEREFLGARRLLEAEGLLLRAKGHSAGRSRAQWQLGRG